MLKALRKLHHKDKAAGNGKAKASRKDKKASKDTTKDVNAKMTKNSRSAYAYSSYDPMPDLNFNPGRRSSCIPAFSAIPSHQTCRRGSTPFVETHRRGSIATDGMYRRGSNSSRGSTSSNISYNSECLRLRRRVEIDQLDKYIEHVKRSADSDNLSSVPNRLCCAQLLKAVLQRREREHLYAYLHSNRSSSESDLGMKSRLDSESKSNHSATIISSRDANNNDGDDNRVTDDNDNGDDGLNYLNNNGPKADKSKSREERVPGALIKAYDSDGTQNSAVSDSDSDDSEFNRRKRPCSNTRRASIAVFPQNVEIF